MESDMFYTISSQSRYTYKIRKSTFIGITGPVTDEESARSMIKKLKKEYYDAAHICYAYIIGHKNKIFRYSDGGEPANTAGIQIYNQISNRNITDVLCSVIRYFGGIKLGIPGLIDAFRHVSGSVLDSARKKQCYAEVSLTFNFPYALSETVFRYIHEKGLIVTSQEFSQYLSGENCTVGVLVRESKLQELTGYFKNNKNVSLTVE